jgi:hypothetical protein
MARPVCRGSRPVLGEEGILVIEALPTHHFGPNFYLDGRSGRSPYLINRLVVPSPGINACQASLTLYLDVNFIQFGLLG